MKDAAAPATVRLDAWTATAVAAALADPHAPVPRTIIAPTPPGLSIRVGRRVTTWHLRFRVGKDQRTLSLGPVVPARVPAVLVQVASVLADARAGRDSDAVALRDGERPVGALVEEFVATLAHKSREERRGYFLRALGPLVSRPASSIARRDLHNAVMAIPGPAARHRAVSDMRALFRWMVRAEILDRDPSVALTTERPPPRQTRQSLAEVRRLYQSCAELEPALAGYLRFQTLTAARRSEVRFAALSEFDLAARTWTIPASRAKNGHVHVIHLSAAALALVTQQLDRFDTLNRRTLLFGRQGNHPLAEADLARLTRCANDVLGRADEDKASRFTCHDARRNFVGIALDHGVEYRIADLSLNHRASAATSAIGRVYAVGINLAERRAATAIVGALIAAPGAPEDTIPRPHIDALAAAVEAYWKQATTSGDDDPEGAVDVALVPRRGGLTLVRQGENPVQKTL